MSEGAPTAPNLTEPVTKCLLARPVGTTPIGGQTKESSSSIYELQWKDAMTDIARHSLAMSKFVDSQNFESAHTEAVLIISAYRTLTEQLLIHIRSEQK
jgi:hypothetical protein